jgi:nitrate/TMAO reductase-like tetraheme cytochrome c subunit
MARYYERVLAWWGRLGLRWRIGMAAVFAVVMAGASVAGYRRWHYMQHDNRFCTSCHLMVDPFQRFSRSVHATLECHNCHEGRVPEQLHQLWLTVVERPNAIGRHARVPNEVCARCHISGDSTRWKIIAATAGHRIHLESKSATLTGMRCVECHGVSLHEFAPVDRTCLQSGCHDRNTIHLGKMAQLTDLHCTTCHNFLAEAPGVAVDSLGQPLTPRAAQCLSCHAMRGKITGLDIAQDPHHGVCGDCHNPHTQTSPQDVSCTNAGCHATWRSVSFHVGVPHPDRCTTCHQPHTWRVDGKNCIRCHANIPREAPTRTSGAAEAARTSLRAPTAVADFASLAGAWPAETAGPPQGGSRPAAAGRVRFSHGDHRGQACSACHSSRVQHGQLLIRSAADCERCHHVGPGRDRCATCHDAAALGRAALETRQSFRLAANQATVTRQLPFEHQRHVSFACTRCHTDPVSRAPAGAQCAACHANHHTAAANCVACHAGAGALALHKAGDHANCTSASCHGSRAANLPASRAMCLMCHTAQTRHAPGRICEQCHRVLARGTN